MQIYLFNRCRHTFFICENHHNFRMLNFKDKLIPILDCPLDGLRSTPVNFSSRCWWRPSLLITHYILCVIGYPITLYNYSTTTLPSWSLILLNISCSCYSDVHVINFVMTLIHQQISASSCLSPLCVCAVWAMHMHVY